MTNTHLRHRHFVAFPLFLALLGISFVSLSGPSSSLRASIASGQEVMQLSDGAQALLGEDSVLDTASAAPFLRRGSALVRSESVVQIRTPSCDILAVQGAFHLVAGDASTTVSAITAPVLVSVSGQRAVVPVGMQLRIAGPLTGLEAGFAAWRAARTVAPLPEHFMRDRIFALQQFPSVADVLPRAQSSFPPEESHSALELPAAQERRDEAWRLKVLGALRWRIEQEDDAGARALLDRPAYRSAFTAARSLSVLVTLAGRAADGAAGLRPSLLQFLADRHDLWLLAALHPALHTGAWTAGVPALTQEELALLAFGLPQADRAPQGFSPVVVRWWEQAVSGFIAGQKEPAAFVEPLLLHLLPVVEQNVSDGYPERARTLARALGTFAQPVRAHLSPDLQASLAKAEKLVEPSVDLFASSASPASSVSSASSASLPSSGQASASSLPPIDPNERVSIVTSALEQGGALFSLQTKIEPKSDGQSVTVRDILFSSSKGDLSYVFDVDARSLRVSSIVQNGKLLPYPMELDAFLQWVRQ
ncbi:MAG: hypothetical protein Q7S29_00070 [Candidatus Peribacter sp.]|nr:hypothetical protein [Candidatus Peribacter sp.]